MGVLDEFINGSDSDAVSFDIANTSNPVDWSALSKTVGGSILAGTASGLIALPNAVAEAFDDLYGGLAKQLVGLQNVVFGRYADGVSVVWDVAVIDELGLLAGPATIAIVLISVFIVTLGAQKAIETFLGEGGL